MSRVYFANYVKASDFWVGLVLLSQNIHNWPRILTNILHWVWTSYLIEQKQSFLQVEPLSPAVHVAHDLPELMLCV